MGSGGDGGVLKTRPVLTGTKGERPAVSFKKDFFGQGRKRDPKEVLY